MLAELLQTLPQNVQIFSVGDAGQRGVKSLNVWFAAHGSPYYKAEKLHGYVASNKAKVRREFFNMYCKVSLMNSGFEEQSAVSFYLNAILLP